MQRFKENDADELTVINLFLPKLNQLGTDRDAFMAGAYFCYLLGDVLYATDSDPMVGVINQQLYRSSFFAIHDLFTRPGTFEFYLSVFRAIFGADAEIEFVIPGPGQLTINVTALNYETFKILTREIVDGEYVYSPLVTSDTADYIVGQGYRGVYTDQEIKGLIAELSPNGIYTVVNLTDT